MCASLLFKRVLFCFFYCILIERIEDILLFLAETFEFPKYRYSPVTAQHASISSLSLLVVKSNYTNRRNISNLR